VSKLRNFEPGGVGQSYWGPIGDPGRILIRETHESTCSHCGHITTIHNRRNMMDYVECCRGCMRLICLGCWDLMCKGKMGCVPQEKECERIESEIRLRGRLARSAWGCY
jgi:hypothetical protein